MLSADRRFAGQSWPGLLVYGVVLGRCSRSHGGADFF